MTDWSGVSCLTVWLQSDTYACMVPIHLFIATEKIWLCGTSQLCLWVYDSCIIWQLLTFVVWIHYIHTQRKTLNNQSLGVALQCRAAVLMDCSGFNFVMFILTFRLLNSCFWKQVKIEQVQKANISMALLEAFLKLFPAKCIPSVSTFLLASTVLC